MIIACLSFTNKGGQVGQRLSLIENPNYQCHHVSNGSLQGGIKTFLKEKWSAYDGFIFICATGIAVRMILPYIESKTKDPAVLVIDDRGKFVISLVSGHLGGANALTTLISQEIGAMPVITTASDGRGIQALDLFAKENNYFIEDIHTVSKITALMVNDKKIAILSKNQKTIKYDQVTYIDQMTELGPGIEGLVIVSSKKTEVDLSQLEIVNTLLRPRIINVGIGARKDIPSHLVIEAIEQAFSKKDLSLNSIKAFATVDVKANEKGIIQASKFFNTSLRIFNRDEIKEVEDRFDKSSFVFDTIGVGSVSEPCAYLLGGEIILNKYKYQGVTISLALESE